MASSEGLGGRVEGSGRQFRGRHSHGARGREGERPRRDSPRPARERGADGGLDRSARPAGSEVPARAGEGAGIRPARDRPHPAGQKVLAAGIVLKEEVAQPTTDLLRSGKWRSVDFRRYDTKAFAPLIRPGKRHVLGAYIERIRRIFLSMGFTEIQGDFVLSAFWNFEALFQPQDHPARDQLDTFYLSKPAMMPLPDEGIVRRVAEAQENRGTNRVTRGGHTRRRDG